MTRKILYVLLALFLFNGCQKLERSSPVAIEIDGIKVTVSEFEEAFKDSLYAKDDSPSSKKEFLDNFVTRKLILKQAEKQNLDKDPKFLKDVELFWQQSLLKLILDEKSRQVSLSLKVDDNEIKDYYETHKDSDFKDKELADVYGAIKWFLLKEKQQAAIEQWINGLKNEIKLKINYKLLGIGEE